jgi:DNA recombination protein RmuC
MMMLAVTTMRALIRDQKMREQAHLIQKEVRTLLEDVHRLRDRTSSLRKHFAQAESDIKDLETSTDKISRRGERIESVDIEAGESLAVIEPAPRPALARSASS